MVKKSPLIVNLIGAPGAGKSTGAAYIFSQLKMNGVNAELITEFAKDKTWEHNSSAFNNQIYMFGKQSYRLSRCADQVECIVTDSPLFLSVLYNNDPLVLGETFNKLVMQVFNSYNNYNLFVKRTKKYNPIGRNQTEAESDALSVKLKELCAEYGVQLKEINGNITDYNAVAVDVIQKLDTLKEAKNEN